MVPSESSKFGLVGWGKVLSKPNQTTLTLAGRIHESGKSREQQRTEARKQLEQDIEGSIRIEYTLYLS